jgi:hypothetical protein
MPLLGLDAGRSAREAMRKVEDLGDFSRSGEGVGSINFWY